MPLPRLEAAQNNVSTVLLFERQIGAANEDSGNPWVSLATTV